MNSTYVMDIEKDFSSEFVSKYVSPKTYGLIVFPDNFYNMYLPFGIASNMIELKQEQLIAIAYRMPDEGIPTESHIKFIFSNVNGKKEKDVTGNI